MGRAASSTWCGAVEMHVRQRPHALAVLDANRSLSYGELGDESARLCEWLTQQGVRPGDRLGIRLAKSWREVVATVAAARLGAVIVNLHPLLSPSQLRHAVEDADIRFLLADAGQLSRLSDTLAPVRARPATTAVTPEGSFHMLRWLDPAEPPMPDLGRWEPLGDELATLIYTSGSTGTPKGVMHSHANLLAFASNVAQYLGAGPDDRVLSLLPFSFSYGLSQLLTTLYAGGALVLQSSGLPGDVLAALERHRITGMAAVPSIWTQLLDGMEQNAPALPALRYVTNAGGRLSEHDCRRFMRLLPDVQVVLMYGCTEVLRSTYLPPEQLSAKPGAIGRPIPNVDVLVTDEQGRSCNRGEQGELVHVGGHVSQGYWRRPAETAQRFKHIWHDGRWQNAFATGDTVRVDEDGVLWFLHRADWMVKSGGFRFSLEDVERQLRDTGLVQEVVAVSADDAMLGQVVHAVVGGPLQWSFDETALRHACRERLPRHMMPRSFIRWPGPLPLLPNGKLDRVRLHSATRDAIHSSSESRRTHA